MNEFFHRVAVRTSTILGTPWSFVIAILIIALWALTGPLMGFSNTWQLIINTGTTIVTFLMVFLIQNTQNRDSKAIHLKLDELIKGVRGARTGLVDLEDLSEAELGRLDKEFRRLRKQHQEAVQDVAENVRAVDDEHRSADRKPGRSNGRSADQDKKAG